MRMLISAVVYTGVAQWIRICWQMTMADEALCLCAGTAVQALAGRLTEFFHLSAGEIDITAFICCLDISSAAGWHG